MFKLIFIAFIFVLTSTATLALDIQGDWQQGAMLVGATEPGAKVFLGNRSLRVSSRGDFVFALGRNAPAQVTLRVQAVDGGIQEYDYAVKQRQYQVQRVDGVPQETVTPPASVLARIREEAALVSQARSQDSDARDFSLGFARPLEGPITGVYGSQRVYNGEPRNPHFGLDIAAPNGSEVVAPADGVVTLVHPGMYFSGGTLVLDHGYGISSSFIHLSEILVSTGQRVKVGDPIAKVGATGRATGPHLDWRMNWFDVRIDPALVLEAFPRSPN